MQAASECPDSSSTASRLRVLLGVTGSVAAIKLPLLVSQLLEIPEVRL